MTNNLIKVKRLAKVSDKKSYPDSYHLSNLDCYIEKQDPKIAVMFGEENAFKTFLCIINSIVDIKESDLIIDKDDNEYRVGGTVKYENDEIESHIEITMYQKYAS